MNKNIVYLCGVLLAACGGEATTITDDIPDTGELEQPLVKQPNYGVKSTDLYECNSSYTGTCYYPDHYTWTVSLQAAGFPPSERAVAQNALNQVVNEINNTAHTWFNSQNLTWETEGFGGISKVVMLTNVGNDLPAQFTITRGSAGCASGLCMQSITAYGGSSCSSVGSILNEPTPMNGTHRRCSARVMTLDTPDIFGAVSSGADRESLARHAIGYNVAAALGVGLSGNTSFGSYANTNAFPVGKTTIGSNNYCRIKHSPWSAGGTTDAYQAVPPFGGSLPCGS